jgi:alkylation response protein AidB-like acyl-CoA dehydrogenase
MKLSGEQIELRDVTRRFLAERVSPQYLRGRIEGGIRSDEAFISSLQDLGLDEGFGGDSPVFSLEELALIAHECGYALVPEPITERLVCSAVFPRYLGERERSEYQERYAALPSALAPNACSSVAMDGTGGTVSGAVAWAWGAEGAGSLITFADTPEGRRAVVVPLNQPGVGVEAATALDLTTALTRITLSSAHALVVSREASVALEDAVEVLKASEAAGVCERVVTMTCEYVKTREQFGRPIGAFQAIQQKLADIHAAAESLKSLSRFAAWASIHSESQRALTCRAAVLHASEVAPRVCEVAIQCHGGIGFTWEYDLHLYLRRAKTIQAAFAMSERRAAELLERTA